MFYKVLMGEDIIDALDSLQCCKYSKRSKMILRCSEKERPEGIVSERLGKIYHVDGWAVPDKIDLFEGVVSLVEINEDTYNTLIESITSGETPFDGSLYEQDENNSEPQLTLAQILKNRITEVEDENTQLKEDLLNTQMALCELYELVNGQ